MKVARTTYSSPRPPPGWPNSAFTSPATQRPVLVESVDSGAAQYSITKPVIVAVKLLAPKLVPAGMVAL